MKSLFQKISSIDLVNYTFLIFITITYIISFNQTPYKAIMFFSLILLFAGVYFAGNIHTTNIKRKIKQIILFVYPVIFLFLIFETFFMVLPFFNNNRFDQIMSEIDFSIFGVNPTVWLERFTFPVLTEFLYVCYFIYFPMPFIILIWLYKKNMLPELEKSIFAFFLCYYGAYIMYFFIPVMGPRFFLADIHNIELTGLFFSNGIKDLILALEPNKLDAFPSLHAAIVMITMFTAFKYNKKIFKSLFPLAIAIIFSLTYLRYHYVIDIIAGITWAGISWLLANKLFYSISPKLRPHFEKIEP